MNFSNKIILITGGTGSFGTAMLENLLKKNQCKEIRIISRDEKKQFDLRQRIRSQNVKMYLSDIRDKASLEVPFKNVDFVFHAAALKQVPSCEFHPMEAVKTNIIGTENIIKACRYSKVKKLICLSTDKAVYPINAMGYSKAMMEKICTANSLNSKETQICITRYGNVIGSRGSLVPQVLSQIKNHETITITDPKMTRFLMSLEDAIELVLHAIRHGKNGDIFIQKAKSATIEKIINKILEINNKKNYPKKIIGIRKGEKIHETLLSSIELQNSIEKKNYFLLNTVNKFNYKIYLEKGKKFKNKINDYTSELAEKISEKELENIIKNIKIY